MNVVFLSLGGNLGNRLENLNKAINEIKAIGAEVVKTSSVYETEAWGSTSKKKYLNQVIQLQTRLQGPDFLAKVLRIEKKLGRQRGADRNADRVIDIDLLFFNKEVINTKGLEIPHPRLHLRNFVLVPLNEIDKNFVHPVLKLPIRTLLKNCKDALEVTVYKEEPPFTYICVEGNIGSGKSTTASELAKKLKVDYLPELFENNYFLPLFYAEPETYAFHLEYSFFISRVQQLSEYFKSPGKGLVCDFSLYKSLWFAKANLSKTEYAFFKKKVKAVLAQLPQPDLVIYLDTDLKNLKQNIAKRGRPYEKNISSAYLRSIAQQYRSGLAALKKIKKMTIAIKTYETKTQTLLMTRIEKHLREIF